MKPTREKSHRPRQAAIASTEIRDTILGFLQGKFYPGKAVDFAKDRPRLLSWVVLEPARWLDTKCVTITGQDYLDLFVGPRGVLMEAVRHGSLEKIQYRPAWLRMVIQSHLKIHGDEIYQKAKGVQALADHTLLAMGKLRSATTPDPVRELAKAAELLKQKWRPAKAAHPRCRPGADPVRETQLGLF